MAENQKVMTLPMLTVYDNKVKEWVKNMIKEDNKLELTKEQVDAIIERALNEFEPPLNEQEIQKMIDDSLVSIREELDNKVDKIDGKSLSTEGWTPVPISVPTCTQINT